MAKKATKADLEERLTNRQAVINALLHEKDMASRENERLITAVNELTFAKATLAAERDRLKCAFEGRESNIDALRRETNELREKMSGLQHIINHDRVDRRTAEVMMEALGRGLADK